MLFYRIIQEATSPVFTLDGLYLLYVDRGCTVIAYCLCDLAPKYHVPDCSAHHLAAMPVHHRLFLATSFHVDENEQKTATVSVADLKARYSYVGTMSKQVAQLLLRDLATRGVARNLFFGGIKVFWGIKLLNSRSGVIFTP